MDNETPNNETLNVCIVRVDDNSVHPMAIMISGFWTHKAIERFMGHRFDSNREEVMRDLKFDEERDSVNGIWLHKGTWKWGKEGYEIKGTYEFMKAAA